jgi:hypothetical protein
VKGQDAVPGVVGHGLHILNAISDFESHRLDVLDDGVHRAEGKDDCHEAD